MSHGVEFRLRGASRSFLSGEAPFETAPDADVLVLAGDEAGGALRELDQCRWTAILFELGIEPLGVHTGESAGTEGSNIVGFARWQLGDGPPSDLFELVRQPATDETALSAAREVLEEAGFTTAVCADRIGRILDRLLRPHFNAVLRALDEGLATADDLDLTVKLGLGHRDGPIDVLERTGLARHAETSRSLFEAHGEPALAPARRAAVAAQREREVRGGRHRMDTER